MKHTDSLAVSDEERPYELCLEMGEGSLTDAQLLAVIIRTGTNGKSAIEVAEEVLRLSHAENGLLGICHLSIRELMQVPGIGRVKAIQIRCVGELSKRISSYRAKKELSFSDPETISRYYMEQLRHEEQEYLICMMLDTRNRLIGDRTITIGTVNASLVSPRELFITALSYHAVSIILVHNHPSGDPSPSREDREVTVRVRKAGELIGIGLLDHIVIGDGVYFSFRQEGCM